MEAHDILACYKEILDRNPRIAVSQVGARPWTAIVSCRYTFDRLILELPESYPIDTLLKRPRISFVAGPDNGAREIHGNAIARSSKNGGITEVSLVPYRLLLIESTGDRGAGTTIERRQNEWRYQPPPPSRPMKRDFRFWVRAMRAISLPLSVFPILIGAALAMINGPLNWLVFMLTLFGGVGAHMATNLISDYFDFMKGVDTTNALSSHTGVLVDELIEPDRILMAAMACFLVTAFCGGLLVALAGWPVLLFGLAGILGGFFYTGGPFAWKYIRLGEVATGFLMGPLMVLGSFYVQTATITVAPLLLSVAVGLLVAAVSFGNNIRDASFDREAGVTTLPATIGAQKSLFFFCLLLLLPYPIAASVLVFDFRFAPVLAMFFMLPWSISIVWKVGKGNRDSMAALSEQASRLILPLQVIRLHFRYCLLLLAGCLFVSFFPNLLRG